MKAEIVEGNLVLTLPLETPKKSASGNLKTSVEIDGKAVTVGVNAYIKAD